MQTQIQCGTRPSGIRRRETGSGLAAIMLTLAGSATALAAMAAESYEEPEPLKPAVCFLPGTDPEIVRRVTEAGFGNAPAGQVAYVYSDSNRWTGLQGDPITLTWSLMADGVDIAVNLGGGCSVNGPSELFSRMDALFASQGGRATWVGRIQEVFDRWSQLTGTSYVRLSSPGVDWDDGARFGANGNGTTRGEIRIGMVPVLGGGGCGSILAFNFFPGNGVGGDMVINRAFSWSSSSNNHRFLRNTVAHEHGHGLGISHVCPLTNTKLMEPFLNTNFDGPQHDDIRAGQRGYGDPFEPNDSDAQATDLGNLASGAVLTMGNGATGPFPFPDPTVNLGSILSIDDNGEEDFFRFQVDGPGPVSVTVTPIGTQYDSSQQACAGSGNCCSGNLIDSDQIANLNVQLIDTDGSTVLATAATQPAGSPEELTDIDLPAAGEYFIRVYEGNAPNQTQLYIMSLSRAAVCAPSSPPAPEMGAVAKNRFLSIQAGDPGRLQAIRVSFVSLPEPFDIWNGMTFFVGEPERVCENSGQGTDVSIAECGPAPGLPRLWLSTATLTCDALSAHFMDWHGQCVDDTCVGGLLAGDDCLIDSDCVGDLHLFHQGIIPDGEYEIQVIDQACPTADEAGYSNALPIVQASWGDLVQDVTECPNGPPNGDVDVIGDVVAVLQKFSNLPCALAKTRADVQPAKVEFVIDIIDATRVLAAFTGASYPFTPADPCAP